jgi:hypothetical protein
MKGKNVETPDQRPLDPVRSEHEERWLEQNREAIAHYNRPPPSAVSCPTMHAMNGR